MITTIKLYNSVNTPVTDKQLQYIADKMSGTRHEVVWLNKLCYDTRNRLNVLEAFKLLDCLINQLEYEVIDIHE
jgi:hypothetical protein